MKKYTLAATKRELVGRKVKNLRAKGEIPATVYGKDVKSTSIAVSKDAFMKVYAQAGETGLVELSVAGDVRPVLIHTVQKDAVKGELLHVEFYQVNLKQKVKTNVPLEFTGDAPAVVGKVGVLLTLIDEVEVEALPTDLPEKIMVDVSRLAEVNQEVKVSGITVPSGVTILTARTSQLSVSDLLSVKKQKRRPPPTPPQLLQKQLSQLLSQRRPKQEQLLPDRRPQRNPQKQKPKRRLPRNNYFPMSLLINFRRFCTVLPLGSSAAACARKDFVSARFPCLYAMPASDIYASR